MTLARSSSFLVTTVAIAIILMSLDAPAQTAVPDAGSLLNQMPPVFSPETTKKPSLKVPSESSPDDASKKSSSSEPGKKTIEKFDITQLRIVGNTIFSLSVLHPLVAHLEGQSVTLAQLQEAVGRITSYYHEHDFPLSRAIIPAQRSAGGVVLIQVVEAIYGDVQIKNTSEVSDSLLNQAIVALRRDDPIVGTPLDSALLLLSDIPGVVVNAVMKPGAADNSSDMDIHTVRTKPDAFSITMDNSGNRYVGRYRLVAAAKALNLIGRGDVLTTSAATTGKGLNLGNIGYDVLLSGGGTRIGGSYSYVSYKLEGELQALGAGGTAGVASIWMKTPLLRSRNANMYGQIQYEDKLLKDTVALTRMHTRRQLRNLVLSMNGDVTGTLFAGVGHAWSVGLTAGRIGTTYESAEAFDSSATKVDGPFLKWNVNLAHQQWLTSSTLLYLNMAGQWSNKNLDSSEKFSLGGPQSVRAYDTGALSGDVGYIGTIEVRYNLRQVQLFLFADTARAWINRHSWTNSANPAVTIGSAGAGVNLQGDWWRLSTSLATPVGTVPSTLQDPGKWRGWVNLGMSF